MKKITRFMILAMVVVVLGGCGKENKNSTQPTPLATPTQQAVTTLPPENVKDSTSDGDPQMDNNAKLMEYYPMQADTEYEYEGKGNEFAAYNRTVDYIDTKNNIIQTRMNNGGTETVEVIQIKDGKITVINRVHECYYRDNLMDKPLPEKQQEILLMEPLKKGTSWTLGDGTKRYISGTDVKVNTPSGQYITIEVTSLDKNGDTKYYYAPKVGLVQEVYSSENMKVSSSLSKVKTDKPYVKTIQVYYPDTKEKIHVEELSLSFKTNEATRLVLEKALRQKALKESYLPIISTNTKINSMYRGRNDIAYLDFSQDIIKDMNVGSGYEEKILQCITNTVGNYYNVSKVYITVDGKLYESGHILMQKGQTFKVNMDNVIEK